AVDLAGDGRSEVLVTSVARGRVISELRRWQDNALKVAATIEGVYLRAAPRPAAPAVLLGQRSGFDEVFAGRVEHYRLREKSFERVESSGLPRGTGIFGLALAPEGSPVALYALDRTGYIAAMTTEGKALWSSNRAFGGYPAPLSAGELFGRGAFEEEGSEEKMRAFQGRLLAEPTTAGIRLVVPRNFSESLVTLPRQRAYGQGQIVIFEGPPESPEELLRSRAFDGYVADLARADVDGDGKAEILFVVNSHAGIISGERGKLVAWRPASASDKVK
ncbi:MAG: hypothetical protein Q8N51_03050, partial [Gammaproteobacteria bacterium]|nr:hypothetical protein [Gammaproteobacteria bacterium]